MVPLNRILIELEQKFDITIHGRTEEIMNIAGVKFLSPDSVENNEVNNNIILFVGSLREKALLPDQQILLIDCCEGIVCDNKKVFFTQASLPLHDVFNAIQNLILASTTLEHCKEELFNLLYRGGGIKEALNKAYSHLNNPISLSDSSFSQLESFPEDEKDFVHYQDLNGKTILKTIFLENMLTMNILKKLLTDPSPLVTKIEDFSYDWIFCGIRIGTSLVAYLCIRCYDRPYSEFDLGYLNILVKVLSIMMQKTEVFQKPTGLTNEYFFKSLLDDGPKDKGYIQNRLQSLGGKSFIYNHILVVHTAKKAPKATLTELYLEQIKTIFPGVLMTYYKDNLTLLLRTDSLKPFIDEREKRLLNFLRLNNLRSVISYPFRELECTSYFYSQAMDLLNDESLFTEDSPLIFYGDHYMDALFLQIKNFANLKSMIHPDIIGIIQYDRIHNSEYLKTLLAYLNQNRNAANAAKSLHIHRSTFFYRMTRLSDLFGIDENAGDLLFTYEYSLRLISFLKRRGMIHDE